MKLFLSFLLVVATIVAIPRESYGMPLPQNVRFRLNHGDVVGPGVQLGEEVITLKKQILKCTYDYAKQGGSKNTALFLLAHDGASCVVPNNIIVTGGLIDVITVPTNNLGPGTMTVGTGDTPSDLLASTSYASVTGIMATTPIGNAATAKKIANGPFNATVTFTTIAATTGKFNLYMEYLITN